jgi:predicted NBD/HSP70 family sugar kinase
LSAEVGVDIGGAGGRFATGDPTSSRPNLGLASILDRAKYVVWPVLSGVVCDDEAPVAVVLPGGHQPGLVVAPQKDSAWQDVPRAMPFEAQLGVPVLVDNAANMAAVDTLFRPARDEDLVWLSLGAGVGGAGWSEGRLLPGRRGGAVEVRHIWAVSGQGGTHAIGGV